MDLYERFPATFIIAEENGELVGYIMCRVEIGMASFKRLGIQRKGHIISIAVLPEHRRQGIGCSLIREAMKTLVLYNAKECILEVRRSNSPAVNLYKKMGFDIIKTEVGYYADGEDAYKMARKLPDEGNESPEIF